MPTPEVDVIDQAAPADAQPAGASRRRFLAMGATAAAALASATVAHAQTSRGPKSFPGAQPGTKLDAATEWKDPILRLVRRITMGLATEDVALARQLGYAGYLEYQLQPHLIDDSALDTLILERLPMTGMTYTQLTTLDSGEVSNQMQDAALYRAAFSKRQLKERLVDFWTDHFTISVNKVGILKLPDDRDVIRANAMTTFPQLLQATSQSAAMLVYLDQNSSRTPTPNQNYAREIMELHTLGVDGGYTQTDVAELSRILTGWSTGAGGVYAFNRNFHDRNAKAFLGRAFPAMPSTATTAAMKAEGDLAIQMLVEHPSTAAYIALKLSRWLLAYDPPQAVVDATAAAYRNTGGSIPAMIKTILTTANLLSAPAKYKRPFHFAASVVRGYGAQVTNIRSIRQAADRMGMPMYQWEQPNGYPDRVDWWSGLVLSRWGFTSTMSTINSLTTTMVSTAPFLTVNTPEGLVNQIALRMYGGEMSTLLRTQLTTYARAGTFNDARARETLALAASAQQFQWY